MRTTSPFASARSSTALGKSVVLGDPWMTRSRMLEICSGMIEGELGAAGGS
jgi:hypothetical protein